MATKIEPIAPPIAVTLNALRLIVITPGSPGKFVMADFVRIYAQKMTAEIYPVQPLARQ